MTKKEKSTYDKHVESMSPAQRKKFDQGYRDLLLSEMLLAAMEEDGISVGQLAGKKITAK